MIDALDIIRAVRYKVKDMSAVKYSDYDIIQYMNDVIDFTNQSYALKNSDFLERIKSYTSDDSTFLSEGVSLPYDLITLVHVERSRDGYMMHPASTIDDINWGEYKVIGGKIFTKEKAFKLLYRARIENVSSAKDSIMLPEIFKPYLVNMTMLCLSGQQDSLATAVDSALQSIIPNRRYAGARVKMPFYC